jgi:hypothetical protein
MRRGSRSLPHLDALSAGVRLAEAMELYGPSELVDKMRELERDRVLVAGWRPTVADELFDEASELSRRIWEAILKEAATANLYITYQPDHPAAGREIVSPDRCLNLRGDPWHTGDRLRLGGYALRNVRIHTAAPPAETSNTFPTETPAPPKPARPFTPDDLDACITEIAAGAPDKETSRNELRDKGPSWFEERGISPPKTEALGERLKEKHQHLQRHSGRKRRKP